MRRNCVDHKNVLHPLYLLMGVLYVEADSFGMERVMEVIGLQKGAIDLLAANSRLRYLESYNENKNASVKSNIRQVFFGRVALRNCTKAEQFVDFYTNYCLPSQRRQLSLSFDRDQWADFLEIKQREAQLEISPLPGMCRCLFVLLVFVAGVTVPAPILDRPTLNRVDTILNTLCATNTGLTIPVDCDEVRCKCCVDEATMQACD